MKKETIKSVKQAYDEYRVAARNHIYDLGNPQRRALLTVQAADESGKLNGMTIVELLAVVNLTNNTGERVLLTAQGKTLTLWAEKNKSALPAEISLATYTPKGK